MKSGLTQVEGKSAEPRSQRSDFSGHTLRKRSSKTMLVSA